jgi:hypothetical protein
MMQKKGYSGQGTVEWGDDYIDLPGLEVASLSQER